MGTRLIITPLLMLSGVAVLANGWAGTVALLVLAGAVLVPYLLIIAAGRTRLPLSVVAALPVLVVVAASVLTTDRVGTGWLRAPVDAVAKLLTAARPAPPTLQLLLPGILLAVVVGTWVGVRTARNAGGFAAVVGGATLYVAGALLTAGMADRFGVIAALMVLLAVAGWIARDRAAAVPAAGPPGASPPGASPPGARPPSAAPPSGPAAAARRMPRGIPLVAIAVAGAAVAATLAPAAGAFEPRRLVTPPQLPLVEPNPLPRLAAYAEQEDVELLRYTGNETRLHLVTLADFDGAVWRANGRYQPVGAVAQAPSLPAAPRRTITTKEITVSGLDGLWLPTQGNPDEVSLNDARVDIETGSLALPQGLKDGLRYRVRAATDEPDDGLSVAAVPATGAERYLQTPRLPNAFGSYAQLAVQGANTPLEQAVLLETVVRQGRKLDTKAPDGSSYARLANFLFGNTGPAFVNGAQSGTSEQFAAAFAVLARSVGLPSRLRAGFRPGEQAPGNQWVVRGKHVLVWPEIYFSGQGWVPFDPTPSDQNLMSTAVSDLKRQALEKVGGAPPPPAPATVQPSRAAAPSTQPSSSRATPPTGEELAAPQTSPLVGAIGMPLGVIGFLLGLLLLLRTLRSLRHRQAGARGAWSEVLDLLPLLKIRPPRWHPADRIAADLARAVPVAPPHPAYRLAAEADRAAFAATEPPAASWAEIRRLRQAAARTVPWYRKLLWPVDPRPLLRR